MPHQREMELEVAIGFLRDTPALLGKIADGLSSEELRYRSSPGEFSILEHACHLKDIEQEGYLVRLARLLAEVAPSLADIDGDRLRHERRYNEQKFEAVLPGFRRARMMSLELISGLSPEQTERSGEVEGVGRVSVKDLIGIMADHDASHCEELAALREEVIRNRA